MMFCVNYVLLLLIGSSVAERCNHGIWTRFFNVDKPTKKGDFETIAKIRRLHSEDLCEKPVQIDVKVVGSLVPFELFAQTVKANIEEGFLCVNDQQGSGECLDYEVRFCCPEVYCPDGMWTPFYNHDTPFGKCDCETLPLLRLKYPDKICKEPLAIDARVADTGLFYTTGGQIVTANTREGFRCNNRENDNNCLDYKVRFCCPQPPEPVCEKRGWTPFLDIDDPSGKGDVENINALRDEYPEMICDNPTAVDARVVTTHESYLTRMQKVEISPEYGLRCFNIEQNCEDYEIRFCCPKDVFPPPECPNGKWTAFYDVDDPTIKGDFETLDALRFHYPDEICDDVIAVDARVRLTGESHLSAGQNVVVNRNIGFYCENIGQLCEDYSVRFCCPSDCNICPEGDWTRFFDIDDPQGEGDLELLSLLVTTFPNEVCSHPTKTDARLLNGDSYMTAEQHVDLSDGFACYNAENDGECCDYKVRFCCPENGVCPHPRIIANGNIIPVPNGLFLPNDTFTYICDAGFVLRGSMMITCQDDLTWDPANDQICEPVVCSEPESIENGDFSPKDGPYVVGIVVTYLCDSHYEIEGLSVITCLNGVWSPMDPPVCVPIECGNPAEIDNGLYQPVAVPYLVTDTVTYSCVTGFELVGMSILTCQPDRTWTQPVPECRPAGDTYVAFVIDNTGSMAFEIAAVRDWTTLCLAGGITRCGMPATGGYIVNTFNDPTTGPLTGPGILSEALVAVSGITANRGGDCPELANTALRDTLNAIPDDNGGCKIYFFTDAIAKDVGLDGQVQNLINTKGCQMIELLTGCCLPVCVAPECTAADPQYCLNSVVDARGNVIVTRRKRQIGPEFGTFYHLAFNSRGRIFLIKKQNETGDSRNETNSDTPGKNVKEILQEEVTMGFCPTRRWAGPAPGGYFTAEECNVMGQCWDKSLARCFCENDDSSCPRVLLPDCSLYDATTLLPIEDDCSHYFECAGGAVSYKPCPTDEVFHEAGCQPPGTIPPPCGSMTP